MRESANASRIRECVANLRELARTCPNLSRMRRELSRIRRESAKLESRTFANASRICAYPCKIVANMCRMRVGLTSRHPYACHLDGLIDAPGQPSRRRDGKRAWCQVRPARRRVHGWAMPTRGRVAALSFGGRSRSMFLDAATVKRLGNPFVTQAFQCAALFTTTPPGT